MLFTKKFPKKLLFSKFCLTDAKRHFCTSLRKKICPTVYKILAQLFQRVLNIKDAMRLGSSYFMFLSSLFLFSLFHLTEPCLLFVYFVTMMRGLPSICTFFIINNSTYGGLDDYPKFASWTLEGKNSSCCS